MNTENGTILIQDLKKSFKKQAVLTGLNLEVPRGMVLALLGPNGAGKTTTIRILSTLIRPDAGTVRVNGYDVLTEPTKVRASIGLTGQYAAVDEYLTGRENIDMIGRLYRLAPAFVKQRTDELLTQFDLLGPADRPVKTYSGGMRRRIDLAMSLIATPAILFLDEPTTGLDPRSRLTLWQAIKDLATTSNVTVLLTTQYMEEADYLADKIVVIDKGHVIAEGTANQLKSQVGSERIELVLADATQFHTALSLIGDQVIQADEKRKIISMTSTGGVHDLHQVLGKFETAKLNIESLSLRKPTLDDVFLTLTGHGATLETTTEEPTP